MKKLILAAGLLFGLSSCTNGIFEDSLNGSWTVFSFEDLTAGTVEFQTNQNSWDLDITVTFDDTRKPNTISGTNTTNQIEGEFSYLGHNRLKVSDMASTYINQPVWADKFLEAMANPDLSYEINNNKLLIYYDSKTKRVTFTRN